MTCKDLSRPRNRLIEAHCQTARGSFACRLNAGRFSMHSYTCRGLSRCRFGRMWSQLGHPSSQHAGLCALEAGRLVEWQNCASEALSDPWQGCVPSFIRLEHVSTAVLARCRVRARSRALGLSSQDAGCALEAGHLVEWQISNTAALAWCPKWEATVITAQLRMEHGSMCMAHRCYLSEFRKF